MTLSINEDRTIITVKSDLLSDFSGISEVLLKVKKDCEAVETLTIEEGDVVNTDEFLVNAADLDLTEFAQGIWGFSLLQYDDSDVLTPEYRCILSNVDLTCKLAAYRNSTDNSLADKVLALGDYNILRDASECPSNCEDYCTIYKNLVDVLSETDCA